jgi:hypothetical protein
MTVDTTKIGIVSKYVLNTDYTQAEFDFFKAVAEEQFAKENPGLSPNQADLAVSYLICHYIFMKKRGASDKLSEKIGDTYVTYAQNQMPNSFIAQYRALLEGNYIAPSRGVERGDAPTSRDFQLSEQRVPDMDNTDPGMLHNG